MTTSAARPPTTSKPDHLEMPTGKPDSHQTGPGQPLRHCPTTARQLLIANRHHSPSAICTPNPCGTGRVIPLRTLATRGFAGRHIQSRVRGMARRHAHETSPCQPTTATKTESSSFAPDSPLPGTPTID